MIPSSVRSPLLLVARFALSTLFLVMGWGKLSDFSATVGYMAQLHAPFPGLAALVAVVAELGGGIAIAAGVLIEPVAIALALYTLATGFIGHAFWTMDGAVRGDMMIHFYKNISIAGGLLALSVAGSGALALRLPMRGRTARS
ncbi:DoxX family protein [Ameyamaea chiangmaiensis NBRC 103196]|uniref:DoxX family protein n=1 Tax=Ameyamaea chiangmaiensis TaxID=442969 RepID=A0A850PHC2_9PROT|nr:DoxX family protein [Ameyamaea chiangmaiensis]MBS4075076.1 DoxX family protein [Ameyamaea chiangmaiensis]NVN41252.1 DoxX family protein [Ameyamaea chiangmaiensis]GBQ65558.1 DoxX family protein [Ameyamaea chiangmaiensis NBRC 103196]